MSLLKELNALAGSLGISVETGVFTGTAPDEYLVLTPLVDSFALHADNQPGIDIQEARISLYAKGSYIHRKNQLVRTLLAAEFTITDRRYIGHEDEAVELLTSPYDLAGCKDAIMQAMYRGTKRNVESEPDSKNTQAG